MVGAKIWTFWADLENTHHFLGLFGRNSSHTSPKFPHSRLWRSRSSFLAVLVWWCAKNPTYGRTMGVFLEKLTFNSSLDNSRTCEPFSSLWWQLSPMRFACGVGIWSEQNWTSISDIPGRKLFLRWPYNGERFEHRSFSATIRCILY